MAIIPIEITSDVICPSCYIGYRALQKAIVLYKKTYPGGSKDEFAITWKPYFIDEVEPGESVLVHDRMARRMTGPQMEAAQTRLIRTGKALGIGFRFGGYIGSSRLAHRLLSLALETEGNETQFRIAEILFKYQFEIERNVSWLGVVVQAGVEGGMDEELVRDFLSGTQGVDEIESEARRARENGVVGVPQFVIGGQHRFDGAADLEEFFEAIVAAREALQ